MSLRVEAWTPPGVTTFQKRIATVDLVDTSGSRSLRGLGSGRMVVAEDWSELDLVSDSTPGSPGSDIATMFRVWDDHDGTSIHIQDWLLEPGTAPLDEDGLMELGGNDVKAALAWAYVEGQDWDGVSADFVVRDGDWIYGGRNTMRNESFEDAPLGITNQGFEDGTRDPWWPGYEGISANAIAQQVIFDTGAWALRVTPLLPQGGASTSVRLQPANFYTVNARIRGVSGVDYQLGASGPGGMRDVVGNSIKVQVSDSPGGYEVQHIFTGTGVFESVSLTFGTAGDQTSTQISVREDDPVTLDGGHFYVDVVTISGFGIGMSPWQPTAVNQPDIPGAVSDFEVSSLQASEGSWSGLVTALPGHGMYQELTGIREGVRYTAAVDVGFIDTAGPIALLLVDVNGNMIGENTQNITTTAFTRLEVEFVVDRPPAGSRGAIHFKVINADDVEHTWHVDAASFFQGRPAATVGEILLDQRVSLDLRAALPFITYDFTDALDSAGVAWDAVLTHTIRHGGTDQLQVVQGFERMGYEARLVVDDYAAGSYLLQVFNPGGLGETHAGASPSILIGQGVATGNVTRRHAAFNAVQALGKAGSTSRVSSAANAGVIGRRETFAFDESLEPSLVAPAQLDEGLNQGITAGVTVLTGPDWPRPVEDYAEGDIIDWNLAEGWVTQRVGAISYQETRDRQLTYTLFPDVETFSGQGAVNEGVRQLLAERKLPHAHDPIASDDEVVPAGGAGAPTIVVAAANSTAFSLARADYFCTGVNDEIVIQAALNELVDIGGRLLLCEGNYLCSAEIDIPCWVHVLGMDKGATYVEFAYTTDTGIGFDAVAEQTKISDLTVDIGTTNCSPGSLIAVRIGDEGSRLENLEILSDGVGVQITAGTLCGGPPDT